MKLFDFYLLIFSIFSYLTGGYQQFCPCLHIRTSQFTIYICMYGCHAPVGWVPEGPQMSRQAWALPFGSDMWVSSQLAPGHHTTPFLHIHPPSLKPTLSAHVVISSYNQPFLFASLTRSSASFVRPDNTPSPIIVWSDYICNNARLFMNQIMIGNSWEFLF